MSNYKITLSYDGRPFLGWQRHGDKPTVQFALEQAVTKMFDVRVPVQGSGRTDRGTHARGQVASLQLPAGTQPELIKEKLNQLLPAEVRITDVSCAAADFHACDSAIAKRYRYLIWNDRKLPAERDGRVWHVKEPLDVQAMVDACSIFVGELDFASFATRTNFKQKSTRRTVTEAVLTHELPMITFDICADGFLYKMVRNIVRAIVKVGEGRYTREDIGRILEAKDRKAAPGTAPASGLYLEQVFYSQDELADSASKEASR
ncbi:MAG: tRNA pseudouridine(38-40) synthase TruA [Deltaproteobacteria bacterium]|nr:tRNA pseudouridine(38-40) synthase TruA [Deltaproteobacteria bacterium]